MRFLWMQHERTQLESQLRMMGRLVAYNPGVAEFVDWISINLSRIVVGKGKKIALYVCNMWVYVFLFSAQLNGFSSYKRYFSI